MNKLEQIVKSVEKSLTTISQNRLTQPTVGDERIAACLEAHGWTKAVAGDGDFTLAVRAIKTMFADPYKGILLSGAAGVGKSALLSVLKVNSRRRPAHWIDCSNDECVSLLDPSQTDPSIISELYGDYVFIDDLGAEPVTAVYGNRVNRVGDFIVRMHSYLRSNPTSHGRLFISTNLHANEVNEKYGSRVFDRIMELCSIVAFTGKSKRKRTIVA